MPCGLWHNGRGYVHRGVYTEDQRGEWIQMVAGNFEDYLDASQRSVWLGLNSPAQIQAFLDATPYSPEDADRCPLRVLQDRLAHCLDGALFAAAALCRLGYPPLVLDIFPDPGRDDDHVLALYRSNGRWGALAKSNFTGLRSREPVYRDVRELVMSYFDVFYNVEGQKTLRSYTRPYNLKAFDKFGWLWNDAAAQAIEKRLAGLQRIPVLTSTMAEALCPVDALTYRAGLLVADPDGLYKPH
jgi:hypothetical protein